MRKITLLAAGLAATTAMPALAAGFVNGSFEAGDASGWTTGETYRGNIFNANLDPSDFTTTTTPSRSSIIAAGTVDTRQGASLGSTVYSGNYSYRVEDINTGGNASIIRQQVNNYTDANIFFAWKSVLLGAHGPNDAATMIITLTDLTDGVELIRREYNAGSNTGVVDGRFVYDGSTNNYYTPQWQIEQLATGSALGHDLLLSVIAADCQPTGHWGYVYLDGFGAVTPPPGGVPEPATWATMVMGFGLAGAAIRRRGRKAALAA